MRFDDSVKTVLAGDAAPGAGAQAVWRQLVDLMGRGRAVADEPSLARLRMLRQAVPVEVRAASARALAFATPDAALVGLFAEDVLSVAAPVLRTVALPAADWLGMLARLSPEGRSILRHRRDLPGEVVRALESFGATDFALPFDGPLPANDDLAAQETKAAPAFLPPSPDTPLSDTPFATLSEIARTLPLVSEAIRRTGDERAGFDIGELVARIDAFQQTRSDPAPPPVPRVADRFTFSTDAQGLIVAVDGVARGALVGVSLAHAAPQGVARFDAAISGAYRQRARFSGARLVVGGRSTAAGEWRVAGEPRFEPRTGRFLGMIAAARRPRLDEGAAPTARQASSDAMRELVHELRTPTNAIAGFAELIEAELLGPVAPGYRRQATTIREQAALLIAAIDDLDTAARIDGQALQLRPERIALAPLLTAIAADLAPLAEQRGTALMFDADRDLTLLADPRAAERLIARLVALALAASTSGTVEVVAQLEPGGRVTLLLPVATAAIERQADAGPLLGAEFTLRLARKLAEELGGDLTQEADRLRLRLPAAD